MAETRKRSYQDGCAFAQSLDLIGERWAMLVMRELMFGPRRFSDLNAALPGIAPTVLTQRLTDLVAAGIVTRRTEPPPMPVQLYELTAWGRDFREVIRVMGAWAARSPHLQVGRPLSVSGALLSLGSMFSPDKAGKAKLTLALILGDAPYVARIRGGALSIEPGTKKKTDATVTGDQNALLPVIYLGKPAAEAIADGTLTIDGDPTALDRFAACFDAPVPAELP